jgi:uncharacterized damage-inducible protein DinB
MSPAPNRPEVWQRGAIAGVEPLLMPVAHALLQVQEDLTALAERVAEDQAWQQPGGAGSIAFHVRHIGGSVDRLLTYARGERLTEVQRAALAGEAKADDPPPPFATMVDEAIAALERALAQVRDTPVDSLLESRAVGRAGLPSTTIGLLFHAAEHATRHAGQAITTARILAGGESNHLVI